MISVCVFGSQARASADRLSDLDVLIVGEPSAIELAKSNWLNAGWNVTAFERSGFERMAEVRSLFIQHLKQESRIVTDPDGYLAKTLETYSPKTEYTGERNDSVRHLLSLPACLGQYWYDLCLADIHYVFVRNLMILHLASRGTYCFDYRELVRSLSGELHLSQPEQIALGQLRSLKHGYRNRSVALDPQPTLTLIRSVVHKASVAWGDLSESSIANGDTTDEYLLLRRRELELVRDNCPTALDKLSSDHPLFELWRSIRGAGGYPRARMQ